jgi:hypothetical protein
VTEYDGSLGSTPRARVRRGGSTVSVAGSPHRTHGAADAVVTAEGPLGACPRPPGASGPSWNGRASARQVPTGQQMGHGLSATGSRREPFKRRSDRVPTDFEVFGRHLAGLGGPLQCTQVVDQL